MPAKYVDHNTGKCCNFVIEEVKRECLKMYVNGMGFRGIERVKNVHYTTIINWVKQVGKLLPDDYDPETIPDVGELDELQTFYKIFVYSMPHSAA